MEPGDRLGDHRRQVHDLDRERQRRCNRDAVCGRHLADRQGTQPFECRSHKEALGRFEYSDSAVISWLQPHEIRAF